MLRHSIFQAQGAAWASPPSPREELDVQATSTDQHHPPFPRGRGQLSAPRVEMHVLLAGWFAEGWGCRVTSISRVGEVGGGTSPTPAAPNLGLAALRGPPKPGLPSNSRGWRPPHPNAGAGGQSLTQGVGRAELWGRGLPCLFLGSGGPGAVGVPWRVAASLQSLPLPSHGPLPVSPCLSGSNFLFL